MTYIPSSCIGVYNEYFFVPSKKILFSMLNPLIINKIQFIIFIEFYLSSNDVHSLYIWDVIRDNEHTREVFEEMTPGITYINGPVLSLLLPSFCHYNTNDIHSYLRNYLLESDISSGIIRLEGIKPLDAKIFPSNLFRILMKLTTCA